ncbi:hypothetical protein PHMEG_00027010 [Phytophthora megakarya]|uniref:Uncharacterized protein n=1 Tax=Phytophthora megakarya TaxID=4795 RepID=A0A225VAT9_9STRA|nr:hypothetical protein PHMEG_00027010 [Phytophthora megakarya]
MPALEDWPRDVELPDEYFNPRQWKFPSVSIGIHGGVGLLKWNDVPEHEGEAIRNGTELCVRWSVLKYPPWNPSIKLAMNAEVGNHRIIRAGEIIGEYLGRIDLFGRHCQNGPLNEGHRMHRKMRSTGNKRLGIDAKEPDGVVRSLNHACSLAARFTRFRVGRILQSLRSRFVIY